VASWVVLTVGDGVARTEDETVVVETGGHLVEPNAGKEIVSPKTWVVGVRAGANPGDAIALVKGGVVECVGSERLVTSSMKVRLPVASGMTSRVFPRRGTIVGTNPRAQTLDLGRVRPIRNLIVGVEILPPCAYTCAIGQKGGGF